MKTRLKSILIVAALGLWASVATAHHIAGTVVCTDTTPQTALQGVAVTVQGTQTTLTGTTDAAGQFYISLPTITDTYIVTITPPAGLTVTSPANGQYSVPIFANGVGGPHSFDGANFGLTGCVPPPPSTKCWMTAGGVKFEPLANENLAVANVGKGPNDSFGGNVYPSCSAFPGDGGHWNHVSHRLNLHLNGQIQRVIECGNVNGTAPGTDSPECTVNFIHWEGWGTISPVNGGNTARKVPVYYEAKVEDRAEPGNLRGAKNQPDDVDRYYIKVWYLNADQTVGAPVPGFEFGTFANPIQITGGNLQIHCTSCD